MALNVLRPADALQCQPPGWIDPRFQNAVRIRKQRLRLSSSCSLVALDAHISLIGSLGIMPNSEVIRQDARHGSKPGSEECNNCQCSRSNFRCSRLLWCRSLFRLWSCCLGGGLLRPCFALRRCSALGYFGLHHATRPGLVHLGLWLLHRWSDGRLSRLARVGFWFRGCGLLCNCLCRRFSSCGLLGRCSLGCRGLCERQRSYTKIQR